MSKIKTHRASAKRFSLTGTGKVKRGKAGKRHLLTGKTTKRKRSLKQASYADATNVAAIKRMLPYA